MVWLYVFVKWGYIMKVLRYALAAALAVAMSGGNQMFAMTSGSSSSSADCKEAKAAHTNSKVPKRVAIGVYNALTTDAIQVEVPSLSSFALAMKVLKGQMERIAKLGNAQNAAANDKILLELSNGLKALLLKKNNHERC